MLASYYERDPAAVPVQKKIILSGVSFWERRKRNVEVEISNLQLKIGEVRIEHVALTPIRSRHSEGRQMGERFLRLARSPEGPCDWFASREKGEAQRPSWPRADDGALLKERRDDVICTFKFQI